MNVNKIIVVLVVLIAGVFVAATESNAGKPDKCSPWPECKDDGGDPPPPPPPTGCTDTFPGFVYTTGGTRKTPAETRLASSSGCRTESLGGGDMGYGPMHMTTDGSKKGVLVWRESSEIIDGQYRNFIRRLDFTVDGSGNLQVGQPVTILPLAGEEALPGDSLGYQLGDVWGDATHNSLYITVMRTDEFNSGPNAGAGTRRGLIYDLKTLTKRTIFIFDQDTPGDGTPEYWVWPDAGDPSTLPDCYSVRYPQFVPTCYIVMAMRFNPSGTRLYLERNLPNELWSSGEVWRGVMRINTEDMAAGLLPLADWDLSGPELIYAADLAYGAPGGPTGLLPRPGINPYERPDPEIVASGEYFLDADTCALDYAQLADGISAPPQSSMWQNCIVPNLVGHTGFGNGQVWESADTYLFDRNAKRGRGDIYRMYIGETLGTEELLIENGRGMDTGL